METFKHKDEEMPSFLSIFLPIAVTVVLGTLFGIFWPDANEDTRTVLIFVNFGVLAFYTMHMWEEEKFIEWTLMILLWVIFALSGSFYLQ